MKSDCQIMWLELGFVHHGYDLIELQLAWEMYLRRNKYVMPNACLSLQIFDYSLNTPCILRQTGEFCGKIPLKYNCASKCEVHGVWHLVQQSSRTSTRTISVCMALTLNVYATLGLMSCPPIGWALSSWWADMLELTVFRCQLDTFKKTIWIHQFNSVLP